MDADKCQIWGEIKRREPDFAAGLTEIIKVLGKSKAIRIEIDDEVLLDTGVNRPQPAARPVRRREVTATRSRLAAAAPLPVSKPPEPKSRCPC